MRVQTDNYNQPFNINQGSKLNLGSTAKLRTLIHYLEIIAALHERYHGLNKKELSQLKSASSDKISQWAISYLLGTGDQTIEAMLDSALNRTYSASLHEVFYTGGGVHRFSNFNEKDNQRTVSLRNAFRRSVNLVFIRLMRDIVNYHIYQGNNFSNEMLRKADHPKRKAYLDRFVEHESTLYLDKFYKKYHPLSQQKKLALLHDTIRPSLYQRPALFRFVFPDLKLNDFRERLQDHIIVNEGIYKPAFLIQGITFAGGTPYETHFVRRPAKPKRVLHPEIADLIKKALFNVVERGTAKRVYQAFFNDDGPGLPVGGKTGTGDNQLKELDSDGMVISSKVINRTATFAFIIGDRFFGNITAYVPGPQAGEYSFTSSLPVALLKNLAGHLKGALNTTDMSTLSAKGPQANG